jgi:hypothetical protein
MSEPFKFSNGELAYKLQDLAEIAQKSPNEFLESFNQGYLENWLSYIGEAPIAEKSATIRQSDISDEAKLQEFLLICQPVTEKAPQPTTTPEAPAKTVSTPEISPERTERKFRIVFTAGIGKAKDIRRANQEKIINYSQLSRQMQLINRSGGKIIDIIAI